MPRSPKWGAPGRARSAGVRDEESLRGGDPECCTPGTNHGQLHGSPNNGGSPPPAETSFAFGS